MGNREILFADRPDVFVAGGLLWYPVPDRRLAGPIAPDVLVAFGRPKGRRGSYRQWEEDDIAPQVVFEIRSPSYSVKEMADKLDFYDLYGVVEEYYVYDPAENALRIWLRQGARLAPMAHVGGWTSLRLGVHFALTPAGVDLFDPTGAPFLTSVDWPDGRRARRREQSGSDNGPNVWPSVCGHWAWTRTRRWTEGRSRQAALTRPTPPHTPPRCHLID